MCAVELLEQRQLLSVSTWNNPSVASANWNVDANWSPSGYPNSSSASASLNVDVTVNQTITLGTNVTVNSLTLGDTALTGGSGQSETLARSGTKNGYRRVAYQGRVSR
jgi:hypothetical protein